MARQLRLELRRQTSYRREDFIISPTSEAVVQALDAWPNWHAGCLALVGPAGSGKSHLARAWGRRAGAALLVAAGELPLSLTDLHDGRPVLIEDADRGVADDTLFHLINRAGAEGCGLLLTARQPPTTWAAELPDLRSRLNGLTVALLPEPDDEVLEGVLRKLFRERNIRPSEELISYLLKRIERSVPYAKSVVERLDELADAEQKPVGRALARQILEIDDETPDLFE
ncbi:MAG TPA: chromosomal replication initiator DnaA [Caulobacteraceae bacterium]|jgi:chromosomal replication initiation ATPase DnaA